MSEETTFFSVEVTSDAKVLIISVAARMAGMHPQTLRQYDRLGLVEPGRAAGGGRRYSTRDVALLREVQRLSQDEGVSLAGIQRILELENQVAVLRSRVAELADALNAQTNRADARAQLGSRIFAAGTGGEIVAVRPGERPPRFGTGSQALVVWRPAYGESTRPR